VVDFNLTFFSVHLRM